MSRKFQIAMCGCVTDGYCSPYAVLEQPIPQKILPLVNSRPMSAEELSAELSMPIESVMKHVSRMLSCGFLEEVQAEGKTLYKPAFTILTLEDQRRLQPLLDELSEDVATAVSRNIGKVRDVTGKLTCIQAGYKLPQVEYIIVGAYTLDYLALDALDEAGYLVRVKKMPGGEFVASAIEEGLIDAHAMWMWGHSSQYGSYVFSSHGKLPPTGIRHAFPDLVWFWWELIGSSKLTRWIERLGRTLMELASSPLSVRELANRLQLDEVDLLRDIALLSELGYTTIVGSGEKARVELAAPAFTREDVKLIEDAAAAVHRDFIATLEGKYHRVKEAYRETSPARNGIDIREAFNEIYHTVFSLGLEKLLERGVIRRPPARLDGGEYAIWVAEAKL